MAKGLAALAAHPATPPSSTAVDVAASVALDARGLVLAYRLRAAPEALALPPPAARPGRRDRLWERTCCEAFIGGEDAEPYLELNLSPSEDWALWAFDGYRAGMRAAASVAPRLRVIRGAGELRVDAILDLAVLEGFLGAPPYRVGLAAVVEEQDGRRSFHALAHAAERPDFHARDGWTWPVYPSPGA